MYGEKVDVVTTIYQLKNSYGFRNTNIYDKQGEIRISSYAGGAFIDLNQGRETSVPKELLQDIPMEGKWDGMNYLSRKIKLPEDPVEVHAPLTVKKYHIDKNQHVNNSEYVRIAEEYVSGGLSACSCDTVRIEYKTAAKYGDIIIPKVYDMGEGKQCISLQDKAGNVFANVEFGTGGCR